MITLGLIVAVALVVGAMRGILYRGAYLAVCAGALIAAAAFYALLPSQTELARMVPESAEAVGAAVMADHFPAMVMAALCVAAGALVAGIAYRAPRAIR